MATNTNKTTRRPTQRLLESEPAWDVARLFPAQGCWSESDDFSLPTNRLVEFSDGSIKVLPMRTTDHQLILLFFLDAIRTFVNAATPKLGTA